MLKGRGLKTNPPVMDLRQLEHFCAVARNGSFSKAAATLSIDQSGLSRQIQKLEENVRSKLLYRNGRGVELTTSGAAFHEAVTEALSRLRSAYAEASGQCEEPMGSVTLGLPTSMSGIIAVALLQALHARGPKIRLHLVDSPKANTQECLASGRVDIVVVDYIGQALVPMEPILTEDLFLIAATLPPQARHGEEGLEIAFDDLGALSQIMTTPGYGTRIGPMRLTADLRKHPNVVINIECLTAIREIVRAGSACAILPVGCVHSEIASGSLRAVRVVDPIIRTSLVLASANNRPFTSAMREVCACLREEVAKVARPDIGWVYLDR